MKNYVYALMMLSVMPTGLFAAGGCSSCNAPQNYGSYNKQRSYSTMKEYDSGRDQNIVDHFVTQDDRRIASEVRQQIESTQFENPDDIQIFVEFGKVILEGKTTSNDNKQAAEDAATNVRGVRIVVNGLYVDNRPVKGANKKTNPNANKK